jgi:YHS domain-containing protein
MQVEEKNAAGRSEYHGQTYCFCSENRKGSFNRNPQQYVKQCAQAQEAQRKYLCLRRM